MPALPSIRYRETCHLSYELIFFSFGLNAGAAINPARDMGPRVLTAMAGWPGTFSVSAQYTIFLSSAELKRNRWLFRASIFEYVNQ
jgi:hypothetical protein